MEPTLDLDYTIELSKNIYFYKIIIISKNYATSLIASLHQKIN